MYKSIMCMTSEKLDCIDKKKNEIHGPKKTIFCLLCHSDHFYCAKFQHQAWGHQLKTFIKLNLCDKNK